MKKYSLAFLCVVFLLVSVLSGCGGGGGTPRASVDGSVVDFFNQPVSDVTVEIAGQATTSTGSNGQFAFSGIPYGQYVMRLSKSGYVSQAFYVLIDRSGYFNPFTIFQTTDNNRGYGQTTGVTQGIYDINASPYQGERTIDATNVDSIVLIPYNLSEYAGTRTVDVTLKFDGQSVNDLNFTAPAKPFKSAQTPGNEILSKLHRDPKGSSWQTIHQMDRNLLLKGLRPSFRSSGQTVQASEIPEGQFYKLFGDNPGYPFTADRVYTGEHCYVYLDRTQNIPKDKLDQMGRAFDYFYQTMIDTFGDVSAYSIDTDSHVYVVFTELNHDMGGYFWSVNEYTNVQLKNDGYPECSNEKEIVFLQTYGYDDDPTGWFNWEQSATAHEFQHLINYINRIFVANHSESAIDSETWINEGLSQVAQDIAMAGSGQHDPELEPMVAAFLNNISSNSLCTWATSDSVDPMDYPPAYLFMRYYADRFGEGELKNVEKSSNTGIDSLLNSSITTTNPGLNFENLFRDWLAAMVLDYLNYSNDSMHYQSWVFSDTDFQNQLGVLMKVGSISIPDTTGIYIYRTDLANVNSIYVSKEGYCGLRILLLPEFGVNFSYRSGSQPEIIRIIPR